MILLCATVIGYRMNCKLKILLALAATGNRPLGQVNGQDISKIINIQTNPPPSEAPLTDTMKFMLTIMNELRYVDAIILTTLSVIIILILVGITIAVKRALSRRSSFYLEIKHNTQVMQARLLTFSDGMRFYRFKLPSTPIILTFKSYVVFASVTISVDQWCIKNTLTKQRLVIPSIIWLTPWKAFQLRRMLEAGAYTVRPLLIHNHEFNYLFHTQTESL